MDSKTIEHLIHEALTCQHVQVEGDGYHFTATIVSETFDDLRSVQRQQKVYAAVNQPISTGELHALSLKTYTPKEWAEQQETNHG
ncbi:MAG: hypothetical protein COV52_02710 [Gammaproteobacteria bacterium CG11_big_fil_rev_8_21_14_0_20_46_22]|nr:MAG: hypothetical protein COW05_08750 [Gammaproteobacteria bacterium CG12_big_fil_rev_8_21_14_0_65_46_12]PIR11689.1 MAG: hypothetical protein COV52_02710 [Gammaproteobacteria bacterium CG11_big_fil_rev_8_21_14_0_20_46_22]